MEDGQGLSATWSAHSDLPHRSRQGCYFSLTECQKSRRDEFPPELSHLNGPNFLEVNVLLVIRDAVFWDVSSGFLRFRQRANPLVVVVEMLRGRVFLFFQKRQLRVEQGAARFRQVSRGPLDRENVKTPDQASPLASSCGHDGTQMFLPFAGRTRSTHWRQFDMGQRSDTCFASTLLPHGAPRQFVSGNIGTLHTGGMSPKTRAPRDEGCGPVLRHSAEPCEAPPTSPSVALLMDPRAVKAQARFPRCSSVCGCIPLADLQTAQSSADPKLWRSDC